MVLHSRYKDSQHTLLAACTWSGKCLCQLRTQGIFPDTTMKYIVRNVAAICKFGLACHRQQGGAFCLALEEKIALLLLYLRDTLPTFIPASSQYTTYLLFGVMHVSCLPLVLGGLHISALLD